MATSEAPEPDVGGIQQRDVKTASVQPVVPTAEQPEGPTRLAPLQGQQIVALESASDVPDVTDRVLSPAELDSLGLSGSVSAPRLSSAEDSAMFVQSTADKPPLRSSLVSRADNAVNLGTTPTLVAKVAEPAAGVEYVYLFTVCPGTTSNGGGTCENVGSTPTPVTATSGWTTSASWKVPAGKLGTNATYSWTVSVSVRPSSGDPLFGTIWNDVRVFSTGPTLSAPNSATPVLVNPADASLLTTRTPVLKASVSRPVSGAHQTQTRTSLKALASICLRRAARQKKPLPYGGTPSA